jgi:hypothetical protein
LNEVRRAEDKRLSAESRREAWAARMASLILAVFILYLLVTCLHLFTKL